MPKYLLKSKLVLLRYVLIDLVLIIFSLVLSYWLRFHSQVSRLVARYGWRINFEALYTLPHFDSYIRIFSFSTLLILVILYYNGLYKTRTGSEPLQEVLLVVKSTVISFLGVVLISFILHEIYVSRAVLFYSWYSTTLSLSLWRLVKRELAKRGISQGHDIQSVLILGAGRIGNFLAEEISRQWQLSLRVIGFLDDEFPQRQETPSGHKILGPVSKLKEVISRHRVDEIYITFPSERERVSNIIRQCDEENIRVKIIPDMFDFMRSRIRLDNRGPLPVVELVDFSREESFLLKRVFDLVLTFLALMISSPLLLFIVLAMKVDSRGPIFYTQTRIGKGKKPFKFYKFRSMYANVDDARHKAYVRRLIRTDNPYVEEGKNEQQIFKITDDERITRVGRFIRKYSLDELGQLVNVLKGDLSLVGPRAPLPYEYEEYSDWHKKRLEILPGLTSLWVISGRSKLSFEEMVKLDIYYIENWSLWLDIRILIETIPAVLKGEATY